VLEAEEALRDRRNHARAAVSSTTIPMAGLAGGGGTAETRTKRTMAATTTAMTAPEAA
jgi:hypothetical protein